MWTTCRWAKLVAINAVGNPPRLGKQQQLFLLVAGSSSPKTIILVVINKKKWVWMNVRSGNKAVSICG